MKVVVAVLVGKAVAAAGGAGVTSTVAVGIGLAMQNDSGYVLIEKDDDGFIKFKEVVRKRPSSGDYLRCRANRRKRRVDGEYSDENVTWISLTGLDRYYMNEKLAPAAEQAMQNAMNDDNKSCHLEIRILGGLAVPIQLYIDNERIEDYLKGN